MSDAIQFSILHTEKQPVPISISPQRSHRHPLATIGPSRAGKPVSRGPRRAWFAFGFLNSSMKIDDVLVFSGWCVLVLGIYVLARWLGYSI